MSLNSKPAAAGSPVKLPPALAMAAMRERREQARRRRLDAPARRPSASDGVKQRELGSATEADSWAESLER